MEEHSEEETGGRIEEVGHLRARGVPFGEIARRLDLDEPQVRLEWQAWLEGRKAEREADGLQLEDILAQYDEVLRAAWDDHERLGEEIAGLDVHTARARSESLRIALSAIDCKASLLALSGGYKKQAGHQAAPAAMVVRETACGPSISASLGIPTGCAALSRN